MLVFVPIEFPRRIAMGAQHAPGWSTALVQTVAGFESANQNWSQARHAYDVSFAVRTVSDYSEIVEHFHQVRGRAKSFPFKDALDHRVEQSNGQFIATEGSGSPAGLQLAKRYGSGDHAWYRRITRPMTTPAPAVYRTRASVTTVATGDASIDYETGEIEIANDQPGDTYAWSGQFWVPCRYDTDRLPGIIPDRRPGGDLYVQVESIPIVEVRERLL